MSEILGIGPPPSALHTSEDGFCISGPLFPPWMLRWCLKAMLFARKYLVPPCPTQRVCSMLISAGQELNIPTFPTGSSRSLSVGSVGSQGSEPNTPTRLSEVLSAKSFRKAIAKKGVSLKSLKSIVLEIQPAAKEETTPPTPQTKVSSVPQIFASKIEYNLQEPPLCPIIWLVGMAGQGSANISPFSLLLYCCLELSIRSGLAL